MGVFDALANAIKDLTKTIEDNQNSLSDKLREKALDEKVASGQMTEEEAFAQRLEMAKGEMMSCFCTHCGSKIQLHEKFDDGFCRFCGELVGVQEALRGNFSDTAIENIPGEDLFAIATSKSTANMTLVKAAAEKKHMEASRMMAYQCIQDDEYEQAYRYAKVAAGQKDLDGRVYLLVSGVCIEKEDSKAALKELKKISPEKLQTEEAKKLRKLGIESMTKILEERERERRRAEQEEQWRRQAILSSISIPSTPPEPKDPLSEHGPLATATNCGMPFIDVSDM